jgi:hypothetical protein
MVAKVPTAPEMAQVATSRRAASAVAAAEAQGLLVLPCPGLERRKQAVKVGQQQVGRLGQLHRQAGIQHVRGGHALVHEARLLAHVLGQVGEEGDDVVLGGRLDLVDARDLETAALPDRLGGRLGDHAEFRLGVAGMGLDLEPDAEAVLRLPDLGHFGPAVTRNHGPARGDSRIEIGRQRTPGRRDCQGWAGA